MSSRFYSNGAGSSRDQLIAEYDEIYGTPSYTVSDREIEDRIMYNVPDEKEARQLMNTLSEDVNVLISTFPLFDRITPEIEKAYTDSVNLLYKYIITTDIPGIYEAYHPEDARDKKDDLVIRIDAIKGLFEEKQGFSEGIVTMYQNMLDTCIRALISRSRENWSSRMDMGRRRRKSRRRNAKKNKKY